MSNNHSYDAGKSAHKVNVNDVFAIGFIIILVWLYMYGWEGMHQQFQNSSAIAPVALDPSNLPYYTLRSVMRLVIGMVASFIFALVTGYACAKNKHAARVLLPLINFMESVPLLGFLTFTTIFFLFLFPKSVMGLEAAAIFGVFTGQAWNMALIMYQTIRIIPAELNEAAKMFQLNSWQKFWRIEMPYSVPGLLWNTMVSQSAAWFALVATEAIPIGNENVMLPGLGSYIQLALNQADTTAIIYALSAIILMIVFFDQFLFRPLVKWSEKFKYESIRSRNLHSSWVYNLINNGILMPNVKRLYKASLFYFMNFPTMIANAFSIKRVEMPESIKMACTIGWYGAILYASVIGFSALWGFFPNGNMMYLLPMMFETTYRVAIAMGLSVLICTPLGIWIGMSPRLTRILQPIIQIMAAIPQPIFFPIVAIAILMGGGSLDFWSIPLIMTGTSWYVLFNVIAGASTIPSDMIEMSKIFNLKGLNWWFKFSIPCVFPYVVCGIISAAGGAWNSAIAAEIIQWGKNTISIDGIGALVSKTIENNQLPQAALACAALCVLVALCVIFIWKPLYRLAETRYKI